MGDNKFYYIAMDYGVYRESVIDLNEKISCGIDQDGCLMLWADGENGVELFIDDKDYVQEMISYKDHLFDAVEKAKKLFVSNEAHESLDWFEDYFRE